MEKNAYEMTYESNFVKNKEFRQKILDFGVHCKVHAFIKSTETTNSRFSLGTLQPHEESVQESDEYKQVFSAAEAYLNRCLPNPSEMCPYPVLKNFDKIVKQNRRSNIINTWGQFASVFFLLSWYALRILRAPWRKSYHKVKTYSGQYHHAINSNFPPAVAEHLMERLGYIHHKQKQTFFFHQQSLTTSGDWRDTLMHAGMDYFLVHVRCSLASTEKGRSIEIDILTPPVAFSSAPIGIENQRFAAKVAMPMTKEIMARSGTRMSNSQPLRTLNSSATVKRLPQTYSAPLPSYESATMPTRISRGANSESQMNWLERSAGSSSSSSRIELAPSDYRAPGDNPYVYVSPIPTNGECSKPNVPWGHRMPQQSKASVDAARKQRDLRLFSQVSEDLGDLYGAREPVDVSLQDELIRYPPLDNGSFTSSPNRTSGMDEPLEFAARGLKLEGADSRSRTCYPPDFNYVNFLPNALTGNRRPIKPEPLYPSTSGARSQSGHYVRNPPPLSYLNLTSSNEGESSRDLPSRGEYVHVRPPKRPGDNNRPEQQAQQPQQKHIYHEIQDDGWTTDSSSRSSKSGSKGTRR